MLHLCYTLRCNSCASAYACLIHKQEMTARLMTALLS